MFKQSDAGSWDCRHSDCITESLSPRHTL